MSNMILPPISQGSVRRAEEAGGNEQRCLIENCPRERAVQLTHALTREITTSPLMDYLEENWGFRPGTLNLDMRRNIFLVGASLRSMYIDGMWGLLPEERVLDKYFNVVGYPIRGRYFASATPSETQYKYTFLPIRNMEGICITRQQEHPPRDETSFKVYVYPFATLPILTSHIDPKFAIFHLGRTLESRALSDETFNRMVAERPVLKKVLRIYRAWVCPPSSVIDPDHIDSDESSIYEENMGSDIDVENSDGDSVCTVPRRLAFPAQKNVHSRQFSPKRSRSKNQSDNHTRRKRLREAQSEQAAASSGWTSEAVSKWAKECSTSPDDSSRVDTTESKEKA